MDMRKALRARLIDDAAVAALVGKRVYWMVAPQAAPFPRITLTVAGEILDQDYAGLMDLQSARVQVDAWAESYAGQRVLADAILAALLPPAATGGISFGRAFVGNRRDLVERIGGADVSVEVFRALSEFEIWWRAA